jgi:hypothetical protein
MPRTAAATPDEYLDSLTPDRRAVLDQVCRLVRQHVPRGYEEAMNWGAINWQVPLSVYPDTYNKQPLTYVALADHTSTASLYLMMAYMNPPLLARLKDGFTKAGKKLDMGKSCLHFKTAADLPFDVIAEIIASVPLDRYVAAAKRARSGKGKKGKEGKNETGDRGYRGEKGEGVPFFSFVSFVSCLLFPFFPLFPLFR